MREVGFGCGVLVGLGREEGLQVGGVQGEGGGLVSQVVKLALLEEGFLLVHRQLRCQKGKAVLALL